MWVDDRDPSWKNKMHKWKNVYGLPIGETGRYREWDTLKYLFRGIEKFASWVNHIYLITDSQQPEWLNLCTNKVSIIDHSQIIKEEFLPVFNSSAIELNIHKIPGLSDNFVLFNDDVFITKKVNPEDFFIRNIPLDTAAFSTIAPLIENPMCNYIFNNIRLINENFDKYDTLKSGVTKWFSPKNGYPLIRTVLLLPWSKFTGFYEPHICVSYNKDTFITVWDKYEKELTMTTSSKFREAHNHNQWLMRAWQLASNNFIPRSNNFGQVISITDIESSKLAAKRITNSKFKVLCLNDNEGVVDFETSKLLVLNAFNDILPEKSSFEL